MHRQRHQKGSLQVRQHGKRKMWVLLYRDGTTRKYATLGLYSKMSKSAGGRKTGRALAEANARNAIAPDPHITFGEFLEGVALPFLRSKWKRSTAATTENRIQHHLKKEFGDRRLSDLGLKGLQAFLNAKAETLSAQRRGASALGFAGDLQARDRGRLCRPRSDGGALYAEGRQRPSPSNEQRGGGTLHQRIRPTRARYRASCHFRRHAARRDSGTAAPPCER